jgi:glycosyltransferase involved in cell wall biosynthesis
LGLAWIAFPVLLLVMSRAPEFSLVTAICCSLTRLLQQFEVASYLDMAGLIFRCGEDFFQNVSTQLVIKSGLPFCEIRMSLVPFESRAKCVLMGVAMDVSVIVPTWNEEKYLPKCLVSLANQKDAEPFEVIVVDGGSTDRTVELAEKYASKVLVKPGMPVGAARNTGAQNSQDEILAFIDADTMASPHWVKAISDAFRNDSEAIAVTGPTYPCEGTLLDNLVYHIATGWGQRLSLRLGFPHVAGFNCAYRKSAFWSAGGFDESRELSEDLMLSLRIRHEGRIAFNPEMVAYTSLRRIEHFGYGYLTMYYAINDIALMFFHRSLAYPKVR